MKLPDFVYKLAYIASTHNLDTYVVGGAVRDFIMGNPYTDYDLVLEGDPAAALRLLGSFNAKQVIGHAPVYMLTLPNGESYEIALARGDINTGPGKHGFNYVLGVSLAEDLLRRDFTINAMAWSIKDMTLHDPYGGRVHLYNQILHPVSEAFKESPERVLRGAAFAARFGFYFSDLAIGYAIQMQDDFHLIPAEQQYRHYVKMCTKAVVPSMWLLALIETGWLKHYPALHDMFHTGQGQKHHPEGNVLNHAGQCMDVMVGLIQDYDLDPVYAMTAALLHDAGKPVTTVYGDKVTARGHSKAGVPIASDFMTQLQNVPVTTHHKVLEAVRLHMAINGVKTPRSVRRLLARMEHLTLPEYAAIVIADKTGRNPGGLLGAQHRPYAYHIPPQLRLLEEYLAAHDMGDTFKPIIMGRHLIQLGLTPGRNFTPILAAAKQAQVDGAFDDLQGGLVWLGEYLKCN